MEGYSVSFAENQGILVLKVSGIVNKAVASEIVHVIETIYETNKPEKVLIDCTDMKARLSPEDSYYHFKDYDFVKHRPKMSAVLDLPENRDINNINQVVAQEHGFYSHFFYDYEDALKWLNNKGQGLGPV